MTSVWGMNEFGSISTVISFVAGFGVIVVFVEGDGAGVFSVEGDEVAEGLKVCSGWLVQSRK